MSHEDDPLVPRKGLEELHQGLDVVRQRAYVIELPGVGPTGAEVDGGDRAAWAGGTEAVDEPVPAPGAVAEPMDQDDVQLMITGLTAIDPHTPAGVFVEQCAADG